MWAPGVSPSPHPIATPPAQDPAQAPHPSPAGPFMTADVGINSSELSILPHQANGLAITLTHTGSHSTSPTSLWNMSSGPHLIVVSDFDGACREELAIRLQQANDQNEALKQHVQHLEETIMALRDANEKHMLSGDKVLENGIQPPQPQIAEGVIGSEIENGGGQLLAEMAGPNVTSIDPEDSYTGVEVVTAEINTSSSGGEVVAATLAQSDRLEVLFQALKQCQEALQEEQAKRQMAEAMNHSLLTQLNHAHRKEEQMESRFRNEIATRDDQIRGLRQQLQHAENKEKSFLLHPGIKRGRFMLTRASRLECSKCRAVFASEQDAHNSICSHHPMPACQLPNKMVAEVYPTELFQRRYWPCCKQIDSKMPPPCTHGEHLLQAL